MKTLFPALLALAALAGCSAIDGRADVPDADAAGPPPMDVDGGLGVLGESTDEPVRASDAEDTAGGLRAEANEPPSPEGYFDPSSCYDGLDNDEEESDDGLVDCDDPDCDGVSSCRIGNGRRCTPTTAAAPTFAGCSGTLVDSVCLGGGFEVFGSPSPWIAGDGFHPGGDEHDSGIVMEGEVDLRTERVRLSGRFAAPTCAAGLPCIESVAFGVARQSAFTDTSRVRTVAALQYSAAREEVSLVVGGTVVSSWDFLSTDDLWTLDLRPDGEVLVENAGLSEGPVRHVYVPVAGARAVAYGRNINRGAPDPSGARLTELSIDFSLCDMPSAWAERTELSFDLGESIAHDPELPGSPSIERGEDALYVAYHAAGREGRSPIIQVARQTSASFASFRVAGNVAATAFDGAAGSHDRAGERDPELYWDGELFHVFYTAIAEGGRSSIGHASGPSISELTRDGTPVLEPLYWGVDSFEAPTVAAAFDGRLVLVVRALLFGGSTELVAFVESDAATQGFARITSTGLEERTRRSGALQSTAFDAQEIGDPSIRVVEGAFHLYYAGRNGTAWGLGLLASDEMIYYRDVAGTEPILGPRAGMSAFDSVGVLGADFVVADGYVWMVYVGTDGARERLGLARRRAAPEEAGGMTGGP